MSIQEGKKAPSFTAIDQDGEKIKIGLLECEIINTAGHTPACISYKINNTIFVGDAIFMPDIGTARTDFPGANASLAYDSLQKILAFPSETKLYTGHDYPPQNRALACLSTVGEQLEKNILINKKVSRDEFIKNRNQRDAGKPVPKLLLPSIQINLRAGKFSTPENNGVSYLKIPLNKI